MLQQTSTPVPASGWKQPARQEKGDKGQLRGCGCMGAAVFGAMVFFTLMELAGLSMGMGATGEEARRMLLLGAAGLLVFLPMAMLPGRKKRAAERAEQKRIRDLPFDPASEWDRRIRHTLTARTQRARKFHIAALVSFVVLVAFNYGILWPYFMREEPILTEVPGVSLLAVLIMSSILPTILYLSGGAQYINLGGEAVSRREYRQHLVLPILRQHLESAQFQPIGAMDTAAVANCGLIGTLHKVQPNDYLTAVYRGIPLAQADLQAEQRRYRPEYTDSNGDRRPAHYYNLTVFKGRWLMLQSGKTLQNGFYLWSKNFDDAGARQAAAGQGMAPVQLENPRFNQLFDVYAFTPHDAFLFLTPALLEQLALLAQTGDGQAAAQSVAMVCVGNRVQVAIAGVEDAFEPGLQLKGLVEAAARQKIAAEIAVITDTIDALYQNLT